MGQVLEFIFHNGNEKRVLKYQARIVAPDYPFFSVNLFKCECGCNTYSVVLNKIDIGYTKSILNIEYTSILEAFIKYKKLIEECEAGKYNMLPVKEDQMFE